MNTPSTYTLHLGDCLESLRAMPDKSVHCCVTSPPYFGLRDYGVPPSEWPAVDLALLPGLPPVSVPAMRCCLGLEPEPYAFIAHLVLVFREVRRVLRDDGTCWVNIGDSYAGSWGSQGRQGHTDMASRSAVAARQAAASAKKASGTGRAPDGIKPKDLYGIPWMLAFALRADGWFLRQGLIWNKPNPMPESVRDRCTKSHEDVFLLAKRRRYYFDQDAITEPVAVSTVERLNQPTLAMQASSDRVPGKTNGTMKAVGNAETRNKRSVWIIATKPYKGAHFATFPPDLVEPCILAGCPVGGTVLDPFGGSGTTAGVALAHGRRAVVCEISVDYAKLMPGRIAKILAGYEKARRKAARRPPAPDAQPGRCGVTLDLFDGAAA